MKEDILSLEPEELHKRFTEMGLPGYRAKQVFAWLGRGVKCFDDMTDLPKQLRIALDEAFTICAPEEIRRQTSSDGTVKLLWKLDDSETVESVLMSYESGRSICVSTQVGCRQGCAFCASTAGGLVRNLTAGEILAQVLQCGEDINRVVLMGIGEPLDNFDETVKFLKIINHPGGRNLSLRHVSVSTSGLVPEIERLAELGLGVTLSVSLHAADDETRTAIMPVNRKYPLKELMEACGDYFRKTGRRNSYEYVMIDGINTTEPHAERLAGLLQGNPAHVNLIPLNHVEGKPWRAPNRDKIEAFCSILRDKGINATVRRTLGNDIEAACGQLRRKSTAARIDK